LDDLDTLSFNWKKFGICAFNASNIGATCSGSVQVVADEASLTAAIATIGPISVGIDASQSSFQMYSSGVYYEPACSSTNLNHAVLAVGYGTLNGINYFLVKNSWGTDWGQSGYIYMTRDGSNNCGIATYANYPIVTATQLTTTRMTTPTTTTTRTTTTTARTTTTTTRTTTTTTRTTTTTTRTTTTRTTTTTTRTTTTRTTTTRQQHERQ
jgi:hypothetical protein